MTLPTERLRILLADPDETRRAAVRTSLSDEFAFAEASSADEVIAWLDLGDLGITLLDVSLRGAGIPELVGRIRELHPQELVLLVVDEPSVGLCRAAMRAGAYDCLGRHEMDTAQLRALCEAAAGRREERARSLRAAVSNGRLSVRVHEREAAVRLCDASALTLWKSVEVEERGRWLDAWERAVQAVDAPGERRRALEDLVEALARQPRAAELLTAVHLHAAGAVRTKGREDALERARDVLVEALQRLVERRTSADPLEPAVAPTTATPLPPMRLPETPVSTRPAARVPSAGPSAAPPGVRPPAPAPSATPPAAPAAQATAAPERPLGPPRLSAVAESGARASGAHARADEVPDLLWHHWFLADGGEEWTLVGEGRPLARVSVAVDGCRAWIRDAENGGRVVAATLPPVPAGLREVERRLGLQPVLTVRSASVAG
jgi:DNA-binding NarL/FixJ family response regulator